MIDLADEALAVFFSWGGEQYHDAAKELASQLAGLGWDYYWDQPHLDSHFADIFPDTRERIWVYRYIPKLLCRVRSEHPGPLLYLHCDLRVNHRPPRYDLDGADLAFQPAVSLDPPRPNSILAAPIYIADTRPARRFLKLWRAHCMNVDDDRSEHVLLHDVWRYMDERDRVIEFELFDPPLGSIRANDDTPIAGHK